MTEAALTFIASGHLLHHFPKRCFCTKELKVAPEKWLLVRRHHLGLGFPAKFQQIPTATDSDSANFSAWEAHATSRSRYVGTPSAWKASWLSGFVASAATCNALRADFGVAVFAASRELSKAGIQATKMELACHTCHTCHTWHTWHTCRNRTASTLTSFDIRNSGNNCCLSSAIMGWSAPLPAFQTQTFWYTWYALPFCRV